MELLNKLYQYIGKFEKGKLYTIVARPAMGKTILAKQIVKELDSIEGKYGEYIKTLLETRCEQISKNVGVIHSKCKDIDSVVWEIKYSEAEIIIVDSFTYINKYKKNAAKILKKLAKEYDKTIIVLSCISRRCDRRKNARPKRSDMTRKFCQSLWRKSDVVISLYRGFYYGMICNGDIMEIHIQKSNYKTGTFTIDFEQLLSEVLEE